MREPKAQWIFWFCLLFTVCLLAFFMPLQTDEITWDYANHRAIVKLLDNLLGIHETRVRVPVGPRLVPCPIRHLNYSATSPSYSAVSADKGGNA